MIYTHVAAAAVSLAIGFTGGWWVQGWRLGEQIESINAKHAAAAQAAEEKAREKEQADRVAQAVINQEAADAKESLATELAAVRSELRQRSKRPSGGDVPKGPAGPMACTGASLYGEDAEFLVRETARADRLRIDLAACQARYDEAVKLTN